MTNCVVEIYETVALAHAAIELIDDTKFLGLAIIADPKLGNCIMVIRKT